MAFSDLLRERTLAIRDTIQLLEKKLSDMEALRLAAEERTKRQGTEIAKQREIEFAKKRELNLISEKALDAQRLLDEIDKKRSEAVELLLQAQDEQSRTEKLHKETQKATESLQSQISKEKKSIHEAVSNLERIQKELKEQQDFLHGAIIEALKLYLKQQSENLESAFSSQDKRIKESQEYENFKRARHSDPEIAKLCEQRDELLKFINTSMVSGVKEMLDDKIKIIEEKLEKYFPGAIKVPDPTPKNTRIDDLLYFCDDKGESTILLPINPGDWEALLSDARSDRTEIILCFLWSMIKELGIGSKDGEFLISRGFPAFATHFDIEEITILQGFKLIHKGSEVLSYVLTAMPSEVQEILSYEN